MNNLNLLSTYCKVVELGSFSRAAAYLHQPKSRVSRSISRLEESLDTELIKRTTRHFLVTDAGQKLFERIRPLIRELDNELVHLDASNKSHELTGIITITAPEDFGQVILVELIREFKAIHPKIGIKIRLTNEFLDFTQHNIDLAIRFGRLTDSALVQSKLGEVKMVLAASKKYKAKHGLPKRDEDLADHNLLFFKTSKGSIPIGSISTPADDAIVTNSFPMLYNMIKDDQGIGLVPNFICRAELKTGEVLKVHIGKELNPTNFHIVYPQTKALPKRVRMFIDFAKNYMKAHQQ